MTGDPVALGFLLAALVIATYLYAVLLRRRHSEDHVRQQSLDAISDFYGRSGLP